MYKIYNKSFDDLFYGRKVKHLEDLSEDDLNQFAKEKHSNVVVILDGRGRPTGKLNTDETIKAIERAHTFNLFMPSTFWKERHRKIATEHDFQTKIERHKSGFETFELMNRYGLGVYELKPGTTQEVDWTDEFLHDYLEGNLGYVENLVIRDEQNHVIFGTETPVEQFAEQVADGAVKLEDTPYPQLKRLAKEKGMQGYNTATRVELIAFITKKTATDLSEKKE